jgi:hypothetical protein
MDNDCKRKAAIFLYPCEFSDRRLHSSNIYWRVQTDATPNNTHPQQQVLLNIDRPTSRYLSQRVRGLARVDEEGWNTCDWVILLY